MIGIDAVAAYVGKKGIDQLINSFGKNVIERCSRARAINFLEAFIVAVGSGNEESDIAAKLDEIIASEKNTEILFEAYRLVCLSKSKHIGPRAIALLTAEIVLEGRQTAGIEEPWFEVYETFSDMELIATADFYAVCFAKAKDETAQDYKIKNNELVIEWNSEVTDFKQGADRDPINCYACLGPWAKKLENLGLLRCRVTEKIWDYKEDSEQHIDEDGTARKVTHWMDLNAYDEEYTLIIERAHRMVPIGDIT